MAGSGYPLPAVSRPAIVGSAAGGSADSHQSGHGRDGRVDRAEHVVDVGTKLGHTDDTDDGDQTDEQAVLNHGCAAFILRNTLKHNNYLAVEAVNDRLGIARLSARKMSKNLFKFKVCYG